MYSTIGWDEMFELSLEICNEFECSEEQAEVTTINLITGGKQ